MVSSLPSTTHSKAIEKREPDSSCKWRVLEWKAIVTKCSTGNSSQILGRCFPHEGSQVGEAVKSLHLCPWRDWSLIWTSPWVTWSVLGLTCYVVSPDSHQRSIWPQIVPQFWRFLADTMLLCLAGSDDSVLRPYALFSHHAVARWTKPHILKDVFLFATSVLCWLTVQLEPKCTMQEK